MRTVCRPQEPEPHCQPAFTPRAKAQPQGHPPRVPHTLWATPKQDLRGGRHQDHTNAPHRNSQQPNTESCAPPSLPAPAQARMTSAGTQAATSIPPQQPTLHTTATGSLFKGLSCPPLQPSHGIQNKTQSSHQRCRTAPTPLRPRSLASRTH